MGAEIFSLYRGKLVLKDIRSDFPRPMRSGARSAHFLTTDNFIALLVLRNMLSENAL